MNLSRRQLFQKTAGAAAALALSGIAAPLVSKPATVIYPSIYLPEEIAADIAFSADLETYLAKALADQFEAGMREACFTGNGAGR